MGIIRINVTVRTQRPPPSDSAIEVNFRTHSASRFPLVPSEQIMLTSDINEHVCIIFILHLLQYHLLKALPGLHIQ